MKKETKNMLYIFLDFFESFVKAGKEIPSFINIDSHLYKSVRQEILELISGSGDKASKNSNIKKELIGSLPSILIDKKKFPTNESIVKLAEKSLGINILNWKKRSRNEIIGVLISELANKRPEELYLFREAWNNFINVDTQEQYTDVKNGDYKQNFVELWLNFYRHYRGK